MTGVWYGNRTNELPVSNTYMCGFILYHIISWLDRNNIAFRPARYRFYIGPVWFVNFPEFRVWNYFQFYEDLMSTNHKNLLSKRSAQLWKYKYLYFYVNNLLIVLHCLVENRNRQFLSERWLGMFALPNDMLDVTRDVIIPRRTCARSARHSSQNVYARDLYAIQRSHTT